MKSDERPASLPRSREVLFVMDLPSSRPHRYNDVFAFQQYHCEIAKWD